MFYDVFERLCKVKNVTPNRACVDMGLSRSIAAMEKYRDQSKCRSSAENSKLL